MSKIDMAIFGATLLAFTTHVAGRIAARGCCSEENFGRCLVEGGHRRACRTGGAGYSAARQGVILLAHSRRVLSGSSSQCEEQRVVLRSGGAFKISAILLFVLQIVHAEG